MQMDANHDPILLKFPPEIASHIFYLSMDEQDYDPDKDALKKLPGMAAAGTLNPRALVNGLVHSYEADEGARSSSAPNHHGLVTIIRRSTIDSLGLGLWSVQI